MRYILSVVFFISTVLLASPEPYPSIYKEQGTPLFDATAKFEKLVNYDSIKTDIIGYSKEVEQVKKIGYEAEYSQNNQEIKEYLKSLRKLQKQHDSIIKLVMYKLQDTIKKDNYKEFKDLASFGVDYFKDKDRLKNKILSYYKKNRSKKRIASLDTLIKNDKVTIRHYSQYTSPSNNKNIYVPVRKKNIIVLTSKGCSWCKKVKKLLNESGKSYRELDVKSQSGSRLYKKHNGTGVPITIVEDEVIRGYSRDRILQAIE